MITITGRGIAWVAIVLSLAGVATIAAFWAATGRISGREALGSFVAIVVAAATGAWLRGRRARSRQGGRS